MGDCICEAVHAYGGKVVATVTTHRHALAAQRDLWQLQGRQNTWFCGSYFGYGFHEDALQSGLAVAEALGGVRRPWTVAGESDRLWLADRQPDDSALPIEVREAA